MKKLSAYLFLILFSFSVPSFADDISEFEIEGMSIGDSALDFFNRNAIENEKKKSINDNFGYKDKEFFRAVFSEKQLKNNGKFKIYDYLQLHIKTNDKNYILYSVEGKIIFKNNIKDCYVQKDKITEELKSIFPNTKIKNVNDAHKADATGKSLTDSTYFYLNNNKGNAGVACYDWSIETGLLDNLKVFVDTSEFINWLNNKAWK